MLRPLLCVFCGIFKFHDAEGAKAISCDRIECKVQYAVRALLNEKMVIVAAATSAKARIEYELLR